MKTNQKIKVEKVWNSFLGRYFYPNSLGSCVDFSVTQADGDLLVCIDSDKLMNVVYQLPDVPQDTEISGSDVEATPNKVYESPYDDILKIINHDDVWKKYPPVDDPGTLDDEEKVHD